MSVLVRFAVLGLAILVPSCSFSGAKGTPDGAPTPDGSIDAPPARPRRIPLRIAVGAVTAPLSDFPVYVEVASEDLKNRLDANATLLSFQLGDGTVLDHEIQSYAAQLGKLRAWIRVPLLEPSVETRVELRYGTEDVKVEANRAGVWRSDYDVVFHLEQNPVNGTPAILNSAADNPGFPVELESIDLVDGKVGKALDFDGGNEKVTFTNPLLGAVPSTISMWELEDVPSGDEALLFLGTLAPLQARWMFSSLNLNKGSVGLQGDDFTKPDVPLAGWTLVHWTYDPAIDQSRVYANGTEVTASPFTHLQTAATTGSTAILGNAPAGLGVTPGFQGAVDEVRIAHVARNNAWIAAEYANQRDPETFISPGPDEPLP